MAIPEGKTNIRFGNEYIFYNNTNRPYDDQPDNKWRILRDKEVAYGEKVYNGYKTFEQFSEQDQLNTLSKLGDQLTVMAQRERKREQKLLSQIDSNVIDYSMLQAPSKDENADQAQYIDFFNRIYQDEQQYKNLVTKLKYFVNQQDNHSARAPSMLSWFYEYFIQFLSRKLRDEINLWGLQYVYDNYDKNMDERWINEALDYAIERIGTARQRNEIDKIYGNSNEKKYLANLLAENKELLKTILNTHVSSLKQGEDNLKNQIKLLIDDEKNKNNKEYQKQSVIKFRKKAAEGIRVTDVQGFLNDKGKRTPKSRTLAGFIFEITEQKMVEKVLQKNDNFDKIISVPKSTKDIGATDTITLLSSKVQFDLSKLQDALLNAMDDDNVYSQKDINQNILSVVHDYETRKHIEDVFIINTSNKFWAGTSIKNNNFNKYVNIRNIEQVLAIFADSSLHHQNISGNIRGMSADKLDLTDGKAFSSTKYIKNLVSLYLNTEEGAFLDKERDTIKNAISAIFTAAAGNLLFSDYMQIGASYEAEGKSSAQFIHVFDLNGLIVPLSVILYSLGKTYKAQIQQNKIISLEFLGGKFDRHILYPYKEENRYNFNKDMLQDPNFKPKMSILFNEERLNAQQSAKFKIKFQKNFFQIINNLKSQID